MIDYGFNIDFCCTLLEFHLKLVNDSDARAVGLLPRFAWLSAFTHNSQCAALHNRTRLKDLT